MATSVALLFCHSTGCHFSVLDRTGERMSCKLRSHSLRRSDAELEFLTLMSTKQVMSVIVYNLRGGT